ncbi:hypothetical protein BD413DRAFT_616511 [Trametes elegans]|nr:hypothetical protein BD413DRAFT_616511 [Trametes elegans]
MQSSTNSRGSAPRFTEASDTKKFKDHNVYINDMDVGIALPVYLARITFQELRSFHWALVWGAYRKNTEDPSGMIPFGWHMVDVQAKTRGHNPKLVFRHQFKEPDSFTAASWTLTPLFPQPVSAENRRYIISWGETWSSEVGGNCITCICEVIQELISYGVLPQAALTTIQQARGEDMRDPMKRAFHEASAV